MVAAGEKRKHHLWLRSLPKFSLVQVTQVLRSTPPTLAILVAGEGDTSSLSLWEGTQKGKLRVGGSDGQEGHVAPQTQKGLQTRGLQVLLREVEDAPKQKGGIWERGGAL